MRIYQVYSLQNPYEEQVKYIGITGKGLSYRLKNHVNEKGNTRKNNWIKSLKANNLLPKIELIEDNLTLEEAKQKERGYIKLFKSVGADLTNLTSGGDGVFGYKFTKEAKQKISKGNSGKKSFLGKHHSQETKFKMRNIKIGIPIHTKESKEKISNFHKGNKYNLGRKHSEEAKRKVSEFNKGKILSEDTKKKMRDVAIGRRHTVYAIEKMRKCKQGKHIGENNPKTKLTNQDVLKIRELYRPKIFSYQKIANIYNVTNVTIQYIIKRKSWNHI